MNFYERLKALCAERNTTIYALEKVVGMSKGSMIKWQNSSPSGDKLEKIASEFNVSVDYLLGRTDDPNPPGQPSITNIDIPPVLQEVGVAFHGGPNSLSQEDVNEMAKFVEFLRAKKKEEDNKKGTP